MRHLPKTILALIVFVGLGASRAEAVSVRDLVELTRAGLSDQVLLALIEVDRTVFTIDAPTLKMLKDAGVSEAVIIAMIRSGRQEPAGPLEQPIDVAPPPTAPEPQVVVIDHQEPVVREVPVVVPVAVPIYITAPRAYDVSNPHTADARNRPARQPCVQYEYWGFGGKLRPDAWVPPNACK
jgi:hypothetical protein